MTPAEKRRDSHLRSTMSEMILCLGGPAHGRFYRDVGHTLVVPIVDFGWLHEGSFTSYNLQTLGSPHIPKSRKVYVASSVAGLDTAMQLLQAYLTEKFIEGWTPQ